MLNRRLHRGIARAAGQIFVKALIHQFACPGAGLVCCIHLVKHPFEFGNVFVGHIAGGQRGRFPFDEDARFGQFECADIAFDAFTGRRFAERLQYFAKTPSFGSAESLVMAPQMMQPKEFTPEQRAYSDIGEGSVRLSIGLEDVEDLIADLDQALR